MAGLTTEELELFWSKVDRRGPDECWPWTKGCNSEGYGYFQLRGKGWRATRVAFIASGGAFTARARIVLHSCDNPPCCNPAHLSAGTHKQNAEQRQARGRGAPRSGEHNPNAKLTSAAVDEIRRSFTGGRGEVPALARRLGVGAETVRNVTTGRTWTA